MMDPLMETQTALLLLLACILMAGLTAAALCTFYFALINRRFYMAISLMILITLFLVVGKLSSN